jgi:uncharacterized phage protein (TIGR02218 family)
MKTSSSQLLTYLSSHNTVRVADAFALYLVNGIGFYWTNGDTDYDDGFNLYLCHGPSLSYSGGTLRQAAGKEVSTLELEVKGVDFTYNGKTLQQMAHDGDFDDAQVAITRLYMPTWGDYSLGPLNWFTGYVGDVKPKTLSVVLTLNSALDKLNFPMPKRLFQPSCPHVLFSPACGVTKVWTDTMIVSVTSSSIAVSNPGGVSFARGSLRIISGPAYNTYRSIADTTANGGFLILNIMPQFDILPIAGDTVSILRGCDKSWANCGTWNNQARFGGFPSIPKPESIR